MVQDETLTLWLYIVTVYILEPCRETCMHTCFVLKPSLTCSSRSRVPNPLVYPVQVLHKCLQIKIPTQKCNWNPNHQMVPNQLDNDKWHLTVNSLLCNFIYLCVLYALTWEYLQKLYHIAIPVWNKRCTYFLH